MFKRWLVALVLVLLIPLAAHAATTWGPWVDGSNTTFTCLDKPGTTIWIQLWGATGNIYQVNYNNFTGGHDITSGQYSTVAKRNIEVDTHVTSGAWDPDGKAGYVNYPGTPPKPTSVNFVCK